MSYIIVYIILYLVKSFDVSDYSNLLYLKEGEAVVIGPYLKF